MKNSQITSIIIDNVPFDYDMGLKVLKIKNTYNDNTVSLQEEASKVEDITLEELQTLHMEQRSVCLRYMNVEEVLKRFNGILIDKVTLDKTSPTIGAYKDTFSLYNIPETDINILSFKDTSTDRKYFCFVKESKSALTAIASTYPDISYEENLEQIIRHGDLLLYEIKVDFDSTNHWFSGSLSPDNYLKFVKIEA